MKNIQTVEHVWSVICSRSAVDQESNNLSLFNLIERLTFSVPKTEISKMKEGGHESGLFPIEFEIVSRFKKITPSETAAFDVKITISDPDNKDLPVKFEQKVALVKGIRNMRVRNRFTGFPVSDSGEYRIKIEARDVGETDYVLVSTIPLEVEVKVVD